MASLPANHQQQMLSSQPKNEPCSVDEEAANQSPPSNPFASKKKKKNKKKKKRKRALDDCESSGDEASEEEANALNEVSLKRRRRYETRGEAISSATTNESPGPNMTSLRQTASNGSEPIIGGAKRLRLIVGNDTISIEIPQKS